MSRFISRGTLQTASGKDDGKWIVVDPVIYQSDVAARTITVPKGVITDLASVPRIPFVFELVGDYASEAAIVHDYLYSTGIVPRDVADKILREASEVTGVPLWRRTLMYWGVRLGGASHYTSAPTATTP